MHFHNTHLYHKQIWINSLKANSRNVLIKEKISFVYHYYCSFGNEFSIRYSTYTIQWTVFYSKCLLKLKKLFIGVKRKVKKERKMKAPKLKSTSLVWWLFTRNRIISRFYSVFMTLMYFFSFFSNLSLSFVQ